MSLRQRVTCKCENGHEWTTAINGTDAEIVEYFMDVDFHTEPYSDDGREVLSPCVSVRIHLDLKHQASCGADKDVYTIVGRDHKIIHNRSTEVYSWFTKVYGQAQPVNEKYYLIEIVEEK